MNWLAYLNAFACGIMFVFGLIAGSFIVMYLNSKARADMAKQMAEHYAKVEERLLGSLKAHNRIAAAIEDLASFKTAKDEP